MKRRIIGFSGLAGSGKSTAAEFLQKELGFERVRFAGPLKAMLYALGLTAEEIDGSLKEEPCALLGGKTPRWAMQSIGTEWGRQLIDPNLWIHAWDRAVDALPAHVPVVADDVRFVNEVSAVHARGGLVVRVERDGLSRGDHVSETLDLPFDCVIRNGDIGAFRQSLLSMGEQFLQRAA